MADVTWVGKAQAVAQVSTAVVTAFDATTTYTLTINSKFVSVIGNTSVTQTAADLVTAWNASSETEIAQITATSSTGTVTLTHDTAGTPFTVVSSVSGGAGTIGAVTEATAATGPNHVSNTANYSGDALLTTGDNFFAENTSVSILFDIDTFPTDLASFFVRSSFSGQLGLPATNVAGYPEYLPQYAVFGATAIRLDTSNSALCKLNTGVVVYDMTVEGTSSVQSTGVASTIVKGSNSSNIAEIKGGTVDFAPFGGETAQLATLNVIDADVRVSNGVTLATVDHDGGELELRTGFTTLTCHSGTATLKESGAMTTVNANGGTIVVNSSGLITNLNANDSEIDYSQDLTAKTATNATVGAGGSISDPNKVLTITNNVIRGSDVATIIGE